MDDCLPWLILLRAPHIGPIQQHKLLNVYGTPENILSAESAELEINGLKQETIRHFRNHDNKCIDEDLNWLEHHGHYFVSYYDDKYPAILKQITDPPIGLFIDGNPDILQTQQIAIVGSRNPTPVGKQSARYFSERVTASGLTVTSGLAIGIDYCAHDGALEAGGNTIAVLGNGLDKIYPARHKKIAENIRSGGALVSEFPTGTPPLPAHFPRRNRIISGMCLGVLVIEAAHKSGSLITARYAVEQGREVFAVPGSIMNPLSRGCHSLIKDGAKLVETIDDIIEELKLSLQSNIRISSESGKSICETTELDDNYKLLVDSISYDPVSVDKLIELTGLTADAVSSMLLILEIKGVVSSSGGLYMRIN